MTVDLRQWGPVIVVSGDDRTTRADAVLDVGGNHYHGFGQARRAPEDADRPMVGEEVAAARALRHLASQLLQAAAQDIEDVEHHPVRLHP